MRTCNCSISVTLWPVMAGSRISLIAVAVIFGVSP